MVKVSLSGNTIYQQLLAMKGFDAIRPEYNCLISMTISVDTLCGLAPKCIASGATQYPSPSSHSPTGDMRETFPSMAADAAAGAAGAECVPLGHQAQTQHWRAGEASR